MKGIANQLLKWNRAFDKMPEPRRLLMFGAITLPGIICGGLMNGWLSFLGMIYLIVLLIQRWAFVEGHLVKYINKDTTNG